MPLQDANPTPSFGGFGLRGGFTLPACSAVSGTDDEYEVLESLAQLVDKSLVLATPTGEETRYYLLGPLRQYAAARITVDEVAEAGGRHAQYFQDLAEQAEPELRGPRQLKPESTDGGRRVSVLKRQEGAPVLLG